MTLRRLTPADYRRMPWKNGGGETVEIAVFPPDAGLDAFDWRVSLARVAADGPFSIFQGIERTLSVVEGAGIDLVFAGGRCLPLKPGDPPAAFPADVPVSGRLHGGPITDLNVMSRRGRIAHAVTRLAAPQAVRLRRGGVALLHAHDGGATVGDGMTLAPGETAVIAADTEVAPGAARSAFLIVLEPARQTVEKHSDSARAMRSFE